MVPDQTPESHPRDRLNRELRLSDATLLVVSSVIGLGIFLTPGAIAELLPHPGVILAVWIVGGLLSLAGALANAELGAMYPHAGGDYVYLREAFHPAAGFLVGWLSFFVIYAGTIATLAAGFAAGLGPLRPAGRAGAARRGHRAHPRRLRRQLRRRALGGSRQQPDRGAEDRRARGVRGDRAALRRGEPGEPVGARGGGLGVVPLGLRAGALAGSLQLSRLELVGLRGERDPRSRPQRAALALRRPGHLHRRLPDRERRLPLRDPRRGAARPGERRGGGSPRALRRARRHARGRARAGVDPRHAQRHGARGPPHRLRDGPRRPLLPRGRPRPRALPHALRSRSPSRR